MQLILTGRHVQVPAATRADITRRLARLERVLGDAVVSAQCVVSREKLDFVCEITVHARGDHRFHAAGRDPRLPAAVAEAVDKARQQARRLAGRWKDRRKAGPARGRGRGAAGATGEVGATPPAGPRVIRRRGYAVKPMTLDDAVLALEAAGEPCLVFRITPGETLAVIYLRPDGRYGLIDPGE
ncbi:MAG: HPF/RaiA family ribosome-associated protein [Vicinamibacterales bacterium]